MIEAPELSVKSIADFAPRKLSPGTSEADLRTLKSSEMPLGIIAPSNSSSLNPVAAAQGGSDRHSNALVPHPIAKLPNELLEQIFIEHARDTYQPGSIYTDIKAHQLRPERIDATYVCRLWREICLHSPPLDLYHHDPQPEMDFDISGTFLEAATHC